MAGLDLSGYLDDGGLTLTGVASSKYPDGHTYRVPPLSWPDTLRLRRLVGKHGTAAPSIVDEADADDLAALVTRDDGTECTMAEKLLGPAYQAMIDDGVPPTNVDRITTVAIMHFGSNEVVAQQFVAVASGEARARGTRATPSGKPPAPSGGTRRKRSSSPSKAGSRSAPASGDANTPAAPASTPGRATSTRRPAGKARAAS